MKYDLNLVTSTLTCRFSACLLSDSEYSFLCTESENSVVKRQIWLTGTRSHTHKWCFHIWTYCILISHWAWRSCSSEAEPPWGHRTCRASSAEGSHRAGSLWSDNKVLANTISDQICDYHTAHLTAQLPQQIKTFTTAGCEQICQDAKTGLLNDEPHEKQWLKMRIKLALTWGSDLPGSRRKVWNQTFSNHVWLLYLFIYFPFSEVENCDWQKSEEPNL